MSTDAIRLVVDSLNDEPFNLNTTIIGFDSFTPQRLLQILSDVISWITQTDKLDIRTESADQTALRMFNSLRILKYRPPTDIEQLEEWRVGIVEGKKASIHPVLYYLFANVDMLKERAYLAKFLVRIEVPSEVHDVDTVQMQNEITAVMEKFKETHQRVAEVRGETMVIEDIKSDLRTMEQEKEQLSRRIEKIQRKVQTLPNLERILSYAVAYRREAERLETSNAQRIEERNSVIHVEQKIQRLQAQLRDVEKTGENLDPTDLVEQLEEEIKTNTYLVETKLAREVQSKRAIVSELSKMSHMPAIDKNDLKKLQDEMDEVNSRIITLEGDRDKKEETHDEHFSIYRHQAATVERKKSIAVQKLQEGRSELEYIEGQINAKKEQLRNVGGEEVVTGVQFKNFVNKLRAKSNNYKKRRGEIEDMKAENLVLTRTTEILSAQWTDLKDKIEHMGGEVTETITVPRYERPKTAKPKTEDVDELKNLIRTLNDDLDRRREKITPLQEKQAAMSMEISDLHDSVNNRHQNFERNRAALESGYSRLKEEVESLENRYQTASVEGQMLELKLKVAEAQLEKVNNGTIMEVIDEIEKLVQDAQTESESLQNRSGGQMDASAARQQMIMWRSLLNIFEAKLAGYQNDQTRSDQPIGDRRAF